MAATAQLQLARMPASFPFEHLIRVSMWGHIFFLSVKQSMLGYFLVILILKSFSIDELMRSRGCLHSGMYIVQIVFEVHVLYPTKLEQNKFWAWLLWIFSLSTSLQKGQSGACSSRLRRVKEGTEHFGSKKINRINPYSLLRLKKKWRRWSIRYCCCFHHAWLHTVLFQNMAVPRIFLNFFMSTNTGPF